MGPLTKAQCGKCQKYLVTISGHNKIWFLKTLNGLFTIYLVLKEQWLITYRF